MAGDKATILPYNANKWAEEINRLAGISVEQRAVLSQQIKEYVIENFTLAKMHENYDVMYKEL